MRHERSRSIAARCLPAVSLAALLVMLSTPAAAARIGQVRAVDIEEQRIVIDDRTYRIGRQLVPRYGGSDRLAALQRLRPGMPVEYEIESGAGTHPRVVRLILLADE